MKSTRGTRMKWTSKVITEDIRQAIKKAVFDAGTQKAFCKKTGVSTSLMSKYMRNETRTIHAGTWALLAPHLAPYLQTPSGAKRKGYHRLAIKAPAIFDLIKQWMLNCGMTQPQLAEQLGISQSHLSRILTMRESLHEDRFDQIIDILNPPEAEIAEANKLLDSARANSRLGSALMANPEVMERAAAAAERFADALESIARSLELIANPASVLDTKTGKITPSSRNPGSICEM